jgi:hypothetical protein
LRSLDSGRNWTYIDTGLKGSLWAGVSASDGRVILGGLRGVVVESANGVDNWRRVDTGSRSSITSIVVDGARVVAVGLDGVVVDGTSDGARFRVTQRQDRLPYTAVVVAPGGKLVGFSKEGPGPIRLGPNAETGQASTSR